MTITCAPGGGVSIRCGTTPVDTGSAGDKALSCTSPLFSPADVNRRTGIVAGPNLILDVDRRLAAAVATTPPAPDRHEPVAGVIAHPRLGRLMVVGPFPDGQILDRLWHSPDNRLAELGGVCLPIELGITSAGRQVTTATRPAR